MWLNVHIHLQKEGWEKRKTDQKVTVVLMVIGSLVLCGNI